VGAPPVGSECLLKGCWWTKPLISGAGQQRIIFTFSTTSQPGTAPGLSITIWEVGRRFHWLRIPVQRTSAQRGWFFSQKGCLRAPTMEL
jgi:hypothetical protein